MKRYWLLATLIPFCVLALGTYYVSGTGDQKPEYVLKTMKGLESDAAGLQIKVNMDGITTTVSTKGSESEVEQLSYLDRLDAESYYDDDLKRLVKEHRSFMRGKNDVNAFYEDDQVLAYVATEAHNDVSKVQSNRLTISIMGKLDQETSSFHVLTDKKNDEYISIHDVQVKDQIMKVLVNRMRTDKYPQFYHVGYDMYTIDLTSKSLLKSEQILAAETQSNEISTTTWYIAGNAQIGPSGYAIFDRSENKIIDKVESQTVKRNEGLVNREIRVYDIWNGQWRTLQSEPLHSFLMEDNSMGMSIQYANQELSLAAISENKDTHVMVINVAENKVIRDVQLPLQAIQKEWGRVNYSVVEKDRLYLLLLMSGHHPKTSAAIVELQTGNILYQGEVERKDQHSIDYINANGIKVQK
ncbi:MULTISPECIES: hypothetical protein [unclassified Paenibacillus]|uniref:hypothetical protein n=1 Tax=unclassified Paenibacillus TaxID=185978 RepID=UPI0006F87598|nr:hypothetical protein [Paenibacillus sp. Soil750]KRE70826.1 hypothetical protein ASL11_11060 [Paenibacillus sp. Soil750]